MVWIHDPNLFSAVTATHGDWRSWALSFDLEIDRGGGWYFTLRSRYLSRVDLFTPGLFAARTGLLCSESMVAGRLEASPLCCGLGSCTRRWQQHLPWLLKTRLRVDDLSG